MLDPNDAGIYANRADVYRRLSRFSDALAGYSEAIRLRRPRETTGYPGRAGLYLDSNNYDAAIADFTKMIEIEPKRALNHESRGRAYVRKGDYDNAVADYDAALKISPNDVYALAARDRAGACGINLGSTSVFCGH